MSSRALRKAQREREEQQRTTKLEFEEKEVDEEDEVPTQPAKKSAFALLEEEHHQADEDEDEDGGVTVEHEDVTGEEPTAASSLPKASAKKKKKKKKAKNAAGTAAPTQDGSSQLDEIDAALHQLSTNGNTSTPAATSAGVDAGTDELSRLLAIDTSHLHAATEMRRLFGRAALEHAAHDDENEQPPQQQQQQGGTRRQQRRVQQAGGLAQALRGQGGPGGRLAAVALKKNIFIQGKEDWPVATGGGLGMEIEEKRADGTILFKFAHDRVYQDVQAQFQIAVESMDPQRLVVLLQHNPYHISTLLQVSEIAKQERDHTTSGDLLERALFSFGRAIHSTFTKSLADGKARLDFRRPENREFWLASWRYMQNLSMRGTWRTVYEWAKLLLSLSPDEDWYGIWLVLDLYALKGRQDLDFLNLSSNAAMKQVYKDAPNIQLSRGLAEFRAGTQGKGKQALFKAVGKFPWVVFRLMQELNLQPPPSVWGREPRTEKEKLEAEIYATRAKEVWNTPEHSALLMEVASAVPPNTSSAPIDDSEIGRNTARQVLLSDTPALIALIPRHFTAALASTSDPLPPEDSYASYLPANLTDTTRSTTRSNGGTESATDSLRELHGLHQFFANIFPGMAPGRPENGDAPAWPEEAEVQQRLRETGVDEQTLLQRLWRLTELQGRFGGGGGVGVNEFDGLGEDDDDDEDVHEDGISSPGGLQPTVEDAADSGRP